MKDEAKKAKGDQNGMQEGLDRCRYKRNQCRVSFRLDAERRIPLPSVDALLGILLIDARRTLSLCAARHYLHHVPVVILNGNVLSLGSGSASSTSHVKIPASRYALAGQPLSVSPRHSWGRVAELPCCRCEGSLSSIALILLLLPLPLFLSDFLVIPSSSRRADLHYSCGL
jgi:hypothetical protein